MTLIDLDQSATTAVRREVLEAMWPYLTGAYGNASSRHALGRRAADGLAAARETVARLAGVRPAQIVFTSGGTESDNLAVIGLTLGAIAAGRGRHIVVSAIEHEAVRASADYLARWHDIEVSVLPVNNSGLVDAGVLEAVLRHDTALVSVQHANNEVGTVQPVQQLGELARAVGARFHVDAVQTAGWVSLDASVSPELSTADAITVSAHKLGGPKGVGALVLRTNAPLEPVLHGGGQERDRRSGTENVAGAIGFARALELAAAEHDPTTVARVSADRDAFIHAVTNSVPGAHLTGHPTLRLLGGEPLLVALDDAGVLASSGSACAAGRDEPSPVLLAMGFDADTARTAIRFTWGVSTTQDELTRAAHLLANSAATLRA